MLEMLPEWKEEWSCGTRLDFRFWDENWSRVVRGEGNENELMFSIPKKEKKIPSEMSPKLQEMPAEL